MEASGARPGCCAVSSRRVQAAVVIAALAFVFAAVSAGSTRAATDEPTAALPEPVAERQTLTVSLTLYRLVDSDGGNLGSVRSEAEIAAIGENVQTIWAQAGITFDPLIVRTLDVPTETLEPIVVSGAFDALFSELSQSGAPDLGQINGFFLSEAFGVNGFAPNNTRVFFVVDEPTVPDERVTSHEIGHIFGLRHATDDPGRLMFSGTNGTVLIQEEQDVARYFATGIIDER